PVQPHRGHGRAAGTHPEDLHYARRQESFGRRDPGAIGIHRIPPGNPRPAARRHAMSNDAATRRAAAVRKRRKGVIPWIKGHPNVTRTVSVIVFFLWW